MIADAVVDQATVPVANTVVEQTQVNIGAQVADLLRAEGVATILLDNGEICQFSRPNGEAVRPLEVIHSFYESPKMVSAIVNQIQNLVSVGESSLGGLANEVYVTLRPFTQKVVRSEAGSAIVYSSQLSVTVI